MMATGMMQLKNWEVINLPDLSEVVNTAPSTQVPGSP